MYKHTFSIPCSMLLDGAIGEMSVFILHDQRIYSNQGTQAVCIVMISSNVYACPIPPRHVYTPLLAWQSCLMNTAMHGPPCTATRIALSIALIGVALGLRLGL